MEAFLSLRFLQTHIRVFMKFYLPRSWGISFRPDMERIRN